MLQDESRNLQIGARLVLILCVASLAAPVESQEGFSSHAGELVRFRLPMDGSDVIPAEVEISGVSEPLVAMALKPDGQLYAVTWHWTDRLNRLYLLDPETAEATLVGGLPTLPGQPPYDMTLDHDGRLWLLVWKQGANTL